MTSFLLYDLQYSLFIQSSVKRSCAGGIEHRIMPGEMDMGDPISAVVSWYGSAVRIRMNCI